MSIAYNENSFLVNYKTCKVDAKIINYDKNTVWSDPDFEHMAELMKNVKENSASIKEIAKKGNETIIITIIKLCKENLLKCFQ